MFPNFLIVTFPKIPPALFNFCFERESEIDREKQRDRESGRAYCDQAIDEENTYCSDNR